MNILLVHPKYPDTYWSFKHALKFVLKKVANIPLGIITVASLLPDEWNKKFTNMHQQGYSIPEVAPLIVNFVI